MGRCRRIGSEQGRSGAGLRQARARYDARTSASPRGRSEADSPADPLPPLPGTVDLRRSPFCSPHLRLSAWSEAPTSFSSRVSEKNGAATVRATLAGAAGWQGRCFTAKVSLHEVRDSPVSKREKNVAVRLFRPIIALLPRKNSRRQTKTPLIRFFVGYTYFALAPRRSESVFVCSCNNSPVDCKSGSRVFKNEPIRSHNEENEWSACAGSAEGLNGYEHLSKKRVKRQYGITIAEEAMKILFVFSFLVREEAQTQTIGSNERVVRANGRCLSG